MKSIIVTVALAFIHILDIAIQVHAGACPEYCQCTVESNGALFDKWMCEEVPPQLPNSVTYLEITNNNENTLQVDNLSNFQHVEILNFTHLELESISVERYDTVFSLYNLKLIFLNNNHFLRLNSSMFEWCPSVAMLDFSDNAIKKIQQNTFTNLKNLRVLNLANNNLITLDFDIPVSLVSLDLSHNQLESINFPGDLPNLQHLNLCGNGYHSTPTNFPTLLELTTLCLGDGISSFEPNSLSSLQNLTYLEINGKCDLNETSQIELGRLHNLKVLQLSFITLPVISQELFHGLTSLEELHLIEIQSSSGFTNESLANLTQLQVLNLHHSPLLASTLLEVLETSQLPSLYSLQLSKTNTSSLNGKVLSNLPNLKTLEISDNPLVCDQSAAPLMDAIVSKRLMLKNPLESLCAAPASLAHLQLTECAVTHYIFENSSENTTTSNDTLTQSDGIYYYLNKWGITTDHLLYALLALAILVCLLVITLVVMACCRCSKQKYKKYNNDSSESFALRADNEYTFDNFTHVDIVRRSPITAQKPIPAKRK